MPVTAGVQVKPPSMCTAVQQLPAGTGFVGPSQQQYRVHLQQQCGFGERNRRVRHPTTRQQSVGPRQVVVRKNLWQLGVGQMGSF